MRKSKWNAADQLISPLFALISCNASRHLANTKAMVQQSTAAKARTSEHERMQLPGV
jgi:hypothetical protein